METPGRNVSSTTGTNMECTEETGILHIMATSGITDTRRFLDRFTQVIAKKNFHNSKLPFVHPYLIVH
jgi:hypothetical protein